MTTSTFVYRRRVHYHECDIQGIIFNSHLYAFFDEALRELAREDPQLAPLVPGLEAGGAVASEARLRFLAPIRSGEEIEVEVEVPEVTESLAGWHLVVRRAGALLAEGSIKAWLNGGDGQDGARP